MYISKKIKKRIFSGKKNRIISNKQFKYYQNKINMKNLIMFIFYKLNQKELIIK